MNSDTPHPLTADRQPDWLDQMIENARERGEFDNLPGHGEPIKLPPASSAPSEYDLAFTMLSNAGYAPLFVELGKEAETLEANLTTLRERAAAEIAVLRTELEAAGNASPQPAARSQRRSWWQRLWRGSGPVTDETPRITAAIIDRRRLELRARHQELAAELDAKLVEYHTAIPRELWHAQRIRKPLGEWAATFDAACPSVDPIDSPPIPAETP